MASILEAGFRRLIPTSAASSPRLQRGTRRAEVIAVCAQKGGVGKTTTAVNLAAGLARHHGKRVLLIDLDGQGHCGTSLHAILRGTGTEKLGGLLLGKRRDVNEIALPTALPNLHVVPSDKDLGAAEGVMSGRIGKEFLLRSALKIARTHYDVILLDCPPNLGSLTLNALLGADWLLVPCDMSMLSVEGVHDIFDAVDTVGETLGHQLSILGVLRTRVDARNVKVNEAVERRLAGYTRHVLPVAIPVNTTLTQAQLAGQPISEFDPQCRGAKAYAELGDEVIARLGL